MDINGNQYKLDTFKIIDVEGYRLIDEDGEHWYPISNFSSRFLFKKIKTSVLRDNEQYNKYMRVISYIHPDSNSKKNIKTWFINSEGLNLYVKNVVSSKVWSKTFSPRERIKRDEYLAAVQNMLNIQQPVDNSRFIGFMPDLESYDVWSYICIHRDPNLTSKTIWRRCTKCHFYYPNTKSYFPISNNKLSNQCKQCIGLHFTSHNKYLDYIYTHNGIDLIYQYFLDDDDEKLLYEFKQWLVGGGF